MGIIIGVGDKKNDVMEMDAIIETVCTKDMPTRSVIRSRWTAQIGPPSRRNRNGRPGLSHKKTWANGPLRSFNGPKFPQLLVGYKWALTGCPTPRVWPNMAQHQNLAPLWEGWCLKESTKGWGETDRQAEEGQLKRTMRASRNGEQGLNSDP